MFCRQCGTPLTEQQQFCTQCGTPKQSIQTRTAPDIHRKYHWRVRIGIGIAFIIGIGYYIITLGRSYHPVIADQPAIGVAATSITGKVESFKTTAELEGDYVSFSVEKLLNKRIVRFADPSGTSSLPILAYVTPRGKIVTAMSISESCRSQDFYLEGNNIYCTNCPSYWHMESLEAYACCQKYYPDPIPSFIENGKIKIPLSVLKEWRMRS